MKTAIRSSSPRYCTAVVVELANKTILSKPHLASLRPDLLQTSNFQCSPSSNLYPLFSCRAGGTALMALPPLTAVMHSLDWLTVGGHARGDVRSWVRVLVRLSVRAFV